MGWVPPETPSEEPELVCTTQCESIDVNSPKLLNTFVVFPIT